MLWQETVNKYLEMGKQGTNLDLEANQLILDEVKYNWYFFVTITKSKTIGFTFQTFNHI